MAVSTKMNVDVGGFKSGIAQAQAAVKTLDAALKANEAQFRATGNAEQYLQQKQSALSAQMQNQKTIFNQAAAALKQMTANGVDPASVGYQRMQQTMLNAQAAISELTVQMNGLDESQQDASESAEELTDNLDNIGKSVSLKDVRDSINSITGGLEAAAAKAIDFGKQLVAAVLDSAAAADDTMTLAEKLGISQDDVQRMNKLAPEFEANAETIGTSWKKMKTAMASGSDEVSAAFAQLGVSFGIFEQGKRGQVLTGLKDYRDVWWEVGEAIMSIDDEVEQNRLATLLLGRNWNELSTLFGKGRAAYEEAWEGQRTVDEETMENLATLNDRYTELMNNWDTLKAEVLGTLAPALTTVSETLNTLLNGLMDYLRSDEGQEALEKMRNSISGLFSDLKDISPEAVVEGFTTVFDKVINGLEWISENKDGIVEAMKYIVAGWGGLKLTGALADLMILFNGMKGLGLIKGGETAVNAASSAGAKTVTLEAAKSLLGPGSSFSMMGGISTFGPLVAMLAAGYTGYKMIEANLNDESLNKIYGNSYSDKAEGNMIQTMSEADWAAAQAYWDVYQNTGSEEAMQAREALKAQLEASGYEMGEQAVSYLEQAFENWIRGNESDLSVEEIRNRDPFFFDIKDEVILDDDAEDAIQAQLDGMNLHVWVDPLLTYPFGQSEGYANGLPWVPDTGLYLLHRGERVLTASANRSYTANSNLYVENMNMGGGVDAQALAEAMAAQSRRTMSGFGS